MAGNAIYAHREVLNAASTLVIGLFTLALFFATYGQLRHLRRDFNATHRPEIIVHSVEHATDTTPETRDPAIGARITYFNKGTSAAKDVVIDARIIPINGDPEPGYTFERIMTAKGDIESGAPYHFDVFSQMSDRLASFEEAFEIFVPVQVSDNETADSKLYCIGTISYSDSRGTRRQTGFCWRWGRRRWTRDDSPEYEYAY